MQSKQNLLNNLLHAGIKPGDGLMLHGSMRAVGAVEGGAQTLLDAFVEAVGPQGTVMMYLGCDGPYDDVGRGHLSAAEEADIMLHLPAFDAASIPAEPDHGVLAEIFRKDQRTVFSHNPGARMGAIGKNANAWMADHPLQYGYGQGSPLERLTRAGGKVVLIGSDFDAVTLLHYAESIAPVPEKRIVNIRSPLMIEAVRTWVEIEEFDTQFGVRLWPDRFFAMIVTDYIRKQDIACHLIGRAQSYILPAQGLVDYAVPVITNTAKEYEVR